MRTKTTILSAVALAAGLASASAQVYSANVVGYYNIVTPAGSPGPTAKYNLISHQLLDTVNTNNVNKVLNIGFPSFATDLKTWNGHGFDNYTWVSAADAAPDPEGWYDSFGALANFQFVQGVSAFIQNYSGVALTNTIVGQVVQGPVTTTISNSLAYYAIRVPVAPTNLLQSVVGVASPGLSFKIDYKHFNVASQNFDFNLTYVNAADAAPDPEGWYDSFGANQSANAAVLPQVGAGFALDNYSGAPITWTTSFTVQ